MTRAFLVVIDSVGIGGAPDAGDYFNGTVPDTGANTVGHIARTVALEVPTLDALGLGAALRLASGMEAPGLGRAPTGAWGAATEASRGKDTPSGHWEIMGVPVPWEWRVFPDARPAFPPELTAEIARLAGTDGILGDRHASGTVIIEEEGPAHLQTGRPIVYGSADSVIQIACHEDAFGLGRLIALCEALAPRAHAMRVGRVIARPFVGEAGGFRRTGNRRDFAVAPPGPTLLDRAQAAGRRVHAVGKIGDIVSMHGIDTLAKGTDAHLMEALHILADTAEEGALVVANLVEFDSDYGHRRDVPGYARHLEWFDGRLASLIARLREEDLLVVTADHGNDPTWVGTDHTRERVPVLAHGLGTRELGLMGFADVGALVARHLGIAP